MVFVQKWPFFQTFFLLGNIGQENVFYDILEQKKAFLGYRNKKFKNSKIWHFSNGVKPCFWSKNCLFSKVIFFANIGQKNVFYDILQRKNFFLGYKMSFTIFYSEKPPFLSSPILGNIGQENVFYGILEQKKASLGYKNKKVKKS